MDPKIRPGACFPDYELPDHTGKKRSLSSIQGDDPMILVLSQGAFCPKDRQQHRLLVGLRRDLREVTRKVRPDWDLDSAELREAWEKGDKSKFWPYGKSLKEVFAQGA